MGCASIFDSTRVTSQADVVPQMLTVREAARPAPSLKARGIGRIDEQKIDVAGQRPMLKPIVQHDAIYRVLLQHPAAEMIAVRPDGDDRLRTALRDEKRFIADSSGPAKTRWPSDTKTRGARLRRRYPRLSTATRWPALRSVSVTKMATGVLPVPPNVRFPTLTTRQGNFR